MTRIAALFTPPLFENDEEKTRQAFLLHVILWAFIVVAILLFIFTLLFYREVPRLVLQQVIFGLAASAFLLVLVRRGYVRSASIIQIAALWVFFTATAWTLAGVHHQAYQIGYAVVISIAGFLLGVRGALIMVGVSLLSGGLMVVASDVGLWSFKAPEKALKIWVVSAILFPVLAVLQYLAGRLLRIALAQSRISQAQYRNLVEHIPQRIFVKDLHSVYVSCNANYARDLGIRPEQIVGKNDFDFYPKELAEGYRADDRAVIAGEALKDTEEKYLISGKERWIHTIRVPYRDDQGHGVGVLGIFEDITERKNIEDALRESEMRLRELTDFLPIGIFEIDVAGSIINFNRTALELFRYNAGDYQEGMSALQFFPPEEGQRVRENMGKVIQGTSIPGQEYTLLRKDGSKFIGLIYSSPIIKQNNTVGIRGAIIDITERKLAEEEKRNLEERLQRSEKMEALGQLASGVAHDLNNVLGVLTGYAELLLGEIPEGQRTKEYADKVLQSTEKGAAIIQDLLTLARRGVTVSTVVNLNSVVSGFLRTPAFERIKDYHPRVTFRAESDKNLLNIKGSPVHLEKTLMNLVSNAAESMSGTGEVTIRTESRYLDKPVRGYDEVKEGEYALLIVSDTGIGIPAENIEKIFEPFYTKKTMGRSGTGLGLAIVWGTVKDHNGYIDLQTQVGEGTTFTLYFPVTREEVISQPQRIPIESYMGKGESVLVVDDIAEQRDIAIRLLTRLGYTVHMASSGEEAVEYLKRQRADILILDMIMAPGIDGLETYQRVLEINPKQRAIMVSGFSETDRVREAQKLGAGVYVKKPYNMEKIGVAIREELDKK